MLPPVVMFLAIAYQKDDRPRQEAKSLVDAGYSVFVLSWDRDREFKSVETMDGATVLSTRLMDLRRFSSLGLNVGALVFQVLLVVKTVRLISRLRRRPIIHVHDFNTLLPGCFLRAVRLCVSLVYDSHELSYAAYSEFINPALGLVVDTIERRCLRYAETVITVSEPLACYLRKSSPVVEVIYNCPRASEIPRVTKPDARRELGLPIDAYIVSYVGTIRYDCRLDLLLEVASMLWEESHIQFVVVGWGVLASEFQEAIRRTRARLTLIPYVPHARALCYVTASDLSWAVYEKRSLNSRIGAPWKVFESLACGVPVIVESRSFRARLVEKFGAGLVLDADDPQHVSMLVSGLAKDPLKQHNASCGAKKAAVGFDWETMSPKLIDIYRRLLRINSWER
jgi:glycosyltransferase involved in cell wall biosynthesis